MNKNTENPVNAASWDKIFPKSDKVEHKKVSFKNRYGITLIGDLYFPKNRPAILPPIRLFPITPSCVSSIYSVVWLSVQTS